mmetsp:Transcript_32832/g.97821  ORF Transcript_32832/g.97821 Transcript_32832/m.97821 type:complete len:261 (+) Transcript_32832:137-919(+)
MEKGHQHAPCSTTPTNQHWHQANRVPDGVAAGNENLIRTSVSAPAPSVLETMPRLDDIRQRIRPALQCRAPIKAARCLDLRLDLLRLGDGLVRRGQIRRRLGQANSNQSGTATSGSARANSVPSSNGPSWPSGSSSISAASPSPETPAVRKLSLTAWRSRDWSSASSRTRNSAFSRPCASFSSPKKYHEPLRSMTSTSSAASNTLPSSSMPIPKRTSNMASRYGTPTLFFTIFTRTLAPTTSSLSPLIASFLRTSTRTDE